MTTGPGAYTQTTASFIAAYSLTIPGNTVGADGTVRVSAFSTSNSSTNNKIVKEAYGSFAFISTTNAVSGDVTLSTISGFSNRQATNVQVSNNVAGTMGLTAVAPSYGAINSTANNSLTAQIELATATDTVALENVVVELLPGVP